MKLRRARKGLVLGEDYRVVNYNVWKYWLMVYGGGPSVGRSSKNIYGRSAIGEVRRWMGQPVKNKKRDTQEKQEQYHYILKKIRHHHHAIGRKTNTHTHKHHPARADSFSKIVYAMGREFPSLPRLRILKLVLRGEYLS